MLARVTLPLLLLASARVQAKECTVVQASDGADDSPAIIDAFTQCAVDSTITFEQKNYSVLTPVSLTGLKNVTVKLNGNLLLPKNITDVQIQVNTTTNQPSSYAVPWFYIFGEDVSIYGSDDKDWGAFHGFGQQWWDIGQRILRPQLATFNVTNGLLSGLKVIYPVAWGFNLPGKNIRVENHYVWARPTNGTRDVTTSFPFNTDGLNVSGQNITIDGYFGENGDDCVSVINGARDVEVLNGYCGFSSHGLSIGSLGRGGSVQTVANVRFNNWTMDGAVYGARFKSWTGGQGFAENVTWSNIKLVNVSTGIFITQNYYDQDKGARPNNTNETATRVTNFRYENFTGTLGTNWTDGTCISSPCWNFVQGIDGSQAVIFDLYNGTATNISLVGIDIKKHDGGNPNVLCDPATLADGEQNTLGFQCTNGAFAKTDIKPDDGTGAAMRRGAATLAIGAVVLAALSTLV
ncbi:putative endopolygalacturonase [Exidia glandulosa HHB12029]|uniref:galacturonan 1,4-alpha-galacturonidase n=1 Tax=Exidia glandulosa HHB12029 TaxID=1314781 RepID=A0A166A240_EXIGL|nr:putative endopolygalacturonase [Exidia glandulosa HHB12029]